jgi:hypothetical protein
MNICLSWPEVADRRPIGSCRIMSGSISAAIATTPASPLVIAVPLKGCDPHDVVQYFQELEHVSTPLSTD